MIIAAAVDNRFGLTFNHRRQSRDSVLKEKLLEMSKDTKLWMNEYTKKLFAEEETEVSEHFLEEAGEGEYCFVENVSAAEYEDKIEKIILFKWNRDYPGDFFFDIDLVHWTMTETEDFEGSSHEEITMEVYERAE